MALTVRKLCEAVQQRFGVHRSWLGEVWVLLGSEPAADHGGVHVPGLDGLARACHRRGGNAWITAARDGNGALAWCSRVSARPAHPGTVKNSRRIGCARSSGHSRQRSLVGGSGAGRRSVMVWPIRSISSKHPGTHRHSPEGATPRLAARSCIARCRRRTLAPRHYPLRRLTASFHVLAPLTYSPTSSKLSHTSGRPQGRESPTLRPAKSGCLWCCWPAPRPSPPWTALARPPLDVRPAYRRPRS